MDAPPSAGGPLALLLACLTSGILIPLPEDVALLVAGWEVRVGGMHAGVALVVGTVGTLGRDAIAFGLGRALGPRIERLPWVHRAIGERRLARAHALFAKHGARMLFLTRFAVGLRAPLYFVSGSLDFPLRRFLWLDLVGLAVTVPLTLALGYVGGDRASVALQAAIAHQRLVLLALAVAGLGWLAWRRRIARARAEP